MKDFTSLEGFIDTIEEELGIKIIRSKDGKWYAWTYRKTGQFYASSTLFGCLFDFIETQSEWLDLAIRAYKEDTFLDKEVMENIIQHVGYKLESENDQTDDQSLDVKDDHV